MAAPTFCTTAELGGDEAFSNAVDALAACERVESMAIGYAGVRSAVYRRYQDLCAVASAEQMVALLRHQSAVVRLYAIQHALQAPLGPATLCALEALLEDTSVISVMEGCLLSRWTIGQRLIHELRYCQPAPSVPASFWRAAASCAALGAARFVAMQNLGREHPGELAAMAEGTLRDPAQPAEDRIAALKLYWPQLKTHPDVLARLDELVTHADAALRAAMPALLVELGDEGSLRLLERLREDPAANVASTATFHFVSHPEANPEETRRIFRTKLQLGENHFLRPLARSDDPELLAMLVKHVRSQKEISVDFSDRGPSGAFTRVAKELASFDPPGVYWGKSPRSEAIDYLVRIRDPEALQICRSAYETTQQSGVWSAASRGIVELLSDGTENTLFPLLKDPMLLVQTAAIEELGQVGTAASIPVLEGLVACTPPPYVNVKVAAESALQHIRSRLGRPPAPPAADTPAKPEAEAAAPEAAAPGLLEGLRRWIARVFRP